MTLQDIKKIAVIGSGIMGPGIALSFAKAGLAVTLSDCLPAPLDAAKSVVHSSMLTLAKHGLVHPVDIEKVELRITYNLSLPDSTRDADFVVECISEKKGSKTELFKIGRASCRERV